MYHLPLFLLALQMFHLHFASVGSSKTIYSIDSVDSSTVSSPFASAGSPTILISIACAGF
jgi:hypothetical protein